MYSKSEIMRRRRASFGVEKLENGAHGAARLIRPGLAPVAALLASGPACEGALQE